MATYSALCVGIDRYATNPLSGCVNDAENWAATLKQCGFDARLMTNSEATRGRMLDALLDLIDSDAESICLTFSGHGTYLRDYSGDETNGYDEAIVPYDYQSSGCIVDDEVGGICDRMEPGQTVTFMADCCHSGTITRFFAPPRIIGDSFKERFLPATRVMDELHQEMHSLKRSNRSPYAGKQEVLFSACRASETAKERNGQGDFTRAATKVLRSCEGSITNERFIDATRVVGSWQDQNPQLWSDPSKWGDQLFGEY